MYSYDLKIAAVNLYLDGFSFRNIANLLNLSKSIVHYWFHSDLSIKTRIIHRKSKISYNNINSITQYIHSHPFTSAKIILNIYCLNVCLSTIYNLFHKIGFSKKRTTVQLFSNLSNLQSSKNLFIENIKSIDKNNIISIDETYFSTSLNHNYGWAIGRCNVTKKVNQPKYSVIMAISNKKILAYEIHKENINTQIYYNFLQKHICSVYKHKYLLMENVAFHKSKIITDLIKSSNNINLFIPPYSPCFNPIEHVFSKIKNYFKYQILSDSFDYSLQKSINSVTKNDLYKYYLHCLP